MHVWTIPSVCAMVAAAGGAQASLTPATMTVEQLSVSAPHTVQAMAGDNEIALDGAISGATGSGVVDVALRLDFSFDAQTISGDMLMSGLRLTPTFASGQLEILTYDLGVSLYDGAALVDDIGVAFRQLASLASGQASNILLYTEQFESDAHGAFEAIGDSGVGALDLSFRWTGFAPGDTLSIQFGEGSFADAVQYMHFIPAPGGAAMASVALAALGRRRRG